MIWTILIYYLFICLKTSEWRVNSKYSDVSDVFTRGQMTTTKFVWKEHTLFRLVHICSINV